MGLGKEYNFNKPVFEDLLFAVEVMYQVAVSRADLSHPKASDPVDWEALAKMLHDAISRAGGDCTWVEKN